MAARARDSRFESDIAIHAALMSTQIIVGDARDRLYDLKAESVQAVVTSPPYYNLRDYQHTAQIGTEQSEEDYISALQEVFVGLWHVVHPTGTVWLNIGDSYGPTGLHGIPWRVALALKSDGWCLRADVIWSKSRWMPNGGHSRPVLTHEYLFMLTKQNSGYYYNADAIRELHSPVSLKRWAAAPVASLGAANSMGHKQADGNYRTKKVIPNPLGRLKPSVWTICPSNYKGKHFAVFPEQLVEPCILASSREGDTVLDPFLGSGTTGLVATRHYRQFIGVELNPEYARLAEQRIHA